jgi:DNA-binding NarL/FixJ family response regulator
MTGRINILLVDDHQIVRQGIRLLIERETDIEVVGEAGSGREAIELAQQLQPDVIVMDLSMPDINGLEATKAIKAANPHPHILALTMHDEGQHLVQFLKIGGVAYVPKSMADRELITAIRAVYQGQTYLRTDAVNILVQRPNSDSHADISPDVLSDREHAVLIFTARGFTSREIGQKLSISHRTVETYRQRIMEKLAFDHRSELVDYALKHKLLDT